MRFLILLIQLFFFSVAFATEQSADKVFLKAQQSYQARDLIGLEQSSKILHSQNYVLLPYVDYWVMLLKLSNAAIHSSANAIFLMIVPGQLNL